MILTVELNSEQTLALQRAQCRNTEPIEHTLSRLAGLLHEPKPNELSKTGITAARGKSE